MDKNELSVSRIHLDNPQNTQLVPKYKVKRGYGYMSPEGYIAGMAQLHQDKRARAAGMMMLPRMLPRHCVEGWRAAGTRVSCAGSLELVHPHLVSCAPGRSMKRQ